MGKVVSIFLFQPPEVPTPIQNGDYFWLRTSLGSRIPAFYIRQPQARYTVLYSHGNAEDLGMIYEYLSELSKLLYINIMSYDYSGYGLGIMLRENRERDIEPSESNCYADIEAAYRYLIEVEGINVEHIILYGRSIGSGPSCFLAKRVEKARGSNFGGLILHSPFLSVCRIVIDMGFSLYSDFFPNVQRIKHVR